MVITHAMLQQQPGLTAAWELLHFTPSLSPNVSHLLLHCQNNQRLKWHQNPLSLTLFGGGVAIRELELQYFETHVTMAPKQELIPV